MAPERPPRGGANESASPGWTPRSTSTSTTPSLTSRRPSPPSRPSSVPACDGAVSAVRSSAGGLGPALWLGSWHHDGTAGLAHRPWRAVPRHDLDSEPPGAYCRVGLGQLP